MTTKTLNFPLAGIQHRVTLTTRRLIQERAETVEPIPVKLVREPENDHDSNAIKVVVSRGPYKDLHVGYVPRGIASLLAPKMDEGRVTITLGYMPVVDAEGADADILIELETGRKSTPKKKKSPASKRISKKSRDGA